MKTLVLEHDPMRARGWVAQFGAAGDTCHLARSGAQARLMLIASRYDRLCLRIGEQAGQSHAILAVARACNPDCEIVDLARNTRRSVSGPSQGAIVQTAPGDQPARIG